MKKKLTLLLCLWMLFAGSFSLFGATADNPTNADEYLSAMVSPPAAGFTYVSNGGCAPVTIQFYSQLNGPAYAWTFGDGGTSTDCNPVHTFTLPGTYTVTLVATGGTYTTTITVGATPVVTFTGDSVSCQNAAEVYTVASTIPAASYSWSADGGSVSGATASSATITWSSYGVNYVNYTITTAAGCSKTFRYKVKVIPPPMVNLPCCDKRQKGSDGEVKENPQGHEGVPGGEAPCTVCANGYNCYEASIDPLFGLASEYTWSWTVTNGTITSISPDSTKICVVWGASGMGTISLTTTHKIYGCQTVKECEILISPGTAVALTVAGTCVSSPVVFDASGTSPLSSVSSYFWEFGDGYTETTTLPSTSHLYSFTGSYTATLTITTLEGCKYKISKTFVLISGSKPEIECPGTACEGSRQCYSTTSIGGATYTWTITGDDPSQRVITGNKVCVTWGAGPVGTVSVAVTGGGYTCTNTATAVIAIVGNTVPIYGSDYVCQSSFYETVSTTNYTGACYKWYINGTAQSSVTNNLSFNPSLYTSPIKIEVDVTFELGCCTGKGLKEIIALPAYTLAPYTSTVCIGTTNTYYLIFPAGSPTIPVSWSVDGGIINSSTATSVNVTWNTAGIGTITAGNNSPTEYCNDASNNTWSVNVLAKATGDDIFGEAVVCPGTVYTYYHGYQSPTTSVTVTCPGATVVQGTFSSTITFPAVATPTTFTVSVFYDQSILPGCGTTKTFPVVVVPSIIPAFTIPPGNVCEGDIVTYTCAMPDTQYYEWNVIGGSIISESYSAGTLTIQVQWNSTVTSSINVINKACGTTGTQPITVNGKPVVIITPGNIVCSSTSLSLSVAPVWTSYLWSNTATTPTTSVTTAGTYSVTVSNGVCSNTGSIYVPVVTPTPPVITSFTVTSGTGPFCPIYNQICPNITLGSGTIVSYNWTFTGFNISSSTASCPSVALPSTAGTHTGNWTLVVTDSYGCTHTLGGSLTGSCTPVIGPGCTPISIFNFISYDPCSGLISTSGANYSSIFWDFGDGYVGSGATPTHLFGTPCSKTVICRITDIYGCARDTSFTFNVPYVITNPEINVANAACTGASTLTVTGAAVCSGAGPTYSWTITPAGGGAPVYTATTTSATLNVGSLAIPDGNYNVSVQITIAGCTRTATETFSKGGLTAYFVSCGGCSGSPLTFIDQSIPYNDPLIKWEWTFSGPATITSFLQNPTVTFAIPGTYTAQLIVTDNSVCKDTFTTTFTINPPLAPGNILVNGVSTASGTIVNICPGTTNILTAPAGSYTYVWSTGATTASIPVTDQGDYYVTVFNTSNCAAKVGSIKVKYKPAPEAIIISNGNACSPRFLRAFTGTGYTYNWSYPPSNTSTQSYINLYTAGSVTLIVTNVHGCVDTTIQSFSVNPSPSAFVTYSPQPFCPGNTVTLTGTPSGGTPPYTHLWNNGDTTTSFPTSTPGTYIYNVTDANQCKASYSLALQPALPNGLDKLPYGCYDVCSDVSFCAGTYMPYGWTGQWYNGATPYGAVIPGGGSVSVVFTTSGTFTLHYIPDNPSVSCPAISKPITINYIAIPAITITASNISQTLCKNAGQSILLTANPQSTEYTYNWFLNGVFVGTGYTYSATAAGTYTVEVGKNECCQKTATIIIEEVICCFENPGVNFTQILTDSIVNTNQFWQDKYYIDATVFVVGTAELDLTNVDCVFGPNGQIVVQNQAFLRCNNSVLRPCKKDDIWKGLTFTQNASGWINTTTIKNATVAVFITSNSRGVRLTDNSFIKCQTSVFIRSSARQQSISGNTFETDDVLLPYAVNPTEYWAIKLSGARMDGMIAQNNFRQVRPQNGVNRYFGIYAESSNFTASENSFDDMYRAIDVYNNANVVAIEENQFKINFLKDDYDVYQIRVSDCFNPVLIYENDMDNGLGDRSTAGAIYCSNTYRTHIKDNVINGFYSGIFADRTQEIHISSNTITSNSNVGITLNEECQRSIVSCNTINSMVTNASQSGSPLYGILEWGGNGSSEIYANCIFNMNTAIYLRGGGNLPNLVNNYLYNYKDNGVYTDGYSGSIGNPGGPLNAGRNTFMSNNGGTGGATIDINSTVPISEGGNFGVLFTNNVSSTTNRDEFYSTAACGHQIQGTYPKNQLDKYNVCDIYNLDEWVFKNADGGFILKDPKVAIASGTVNEFVKAEKTELLGMLTAKMQKGAADAQTAADAVLNSEMDKNLAARVIVENSLAIAQPQMAATFLLSKELANIDADLRDVLATHIVWTTSGTFTAAQSQAMLTIDNKNNMYSPMARDMVQVNEGGHDYKFKKVPSLEFKEATNTMQRLINSLSVYPVPAINGVTVEYNVTDANVQAVRVISIIGAEVANFEYTLQAGSVDINVAALAPGMYTVILVTDSKDKPMMTGRFIKQ